MARSIDHGDWQTAYLSEIDRIADLTEGRWVDTVFFGGGTPSLMDPRVVAAVLDRIAARWSLSESLEITLEANPSSVEAERFRGFATAGVTRVSLGVQALNDADLQRLGRLHSAEEALQAVEIARSQFRRVSFDLIYARQEQSADAWRAELTAALTLEPDHLSLYQLTIEDGTAFGDRQARGRLPGLPDEDLGADLYEITQTLTESAGLPAYETSNHAAPGAEAQHNLIYWRSGDYAGIGPGAHGRLTLQGRRWATETPLAPAEWLKTVHDGKAATFPQSEIDDDAALVEFMLMGLRVARGVSLARARRFPGFAALAQNIDTLRADGLVTTDADQLAVTRKGRPLLNSVLGELLR